MQRIGLDIENVASQIDLSPTFRHKTKALKSYFNICLTTSVIFQVYLIVLAAFSLLVLAAELYWIIEVL